MSRWRSKGKPKAGTVVSSVFTYAVVHIDRNRFGPADEVTYNIWESSKHKKLEGAREALKERREMDERRRAGGGQVGIRPEYFLAEWKQVNGQCVLVLMDDPDLDHIE